MSTFSSLFAQDAQAGAHRAQVLPPAAALQGVARAREGGEAGEEAEGVRGARGAEVLCWCVVGAWLSVRQCEGRLMCDALDWLVAAQKQRQRKVAEEIIRQRIDMVWDLRYVFAWHPNSHCELAYHVGRPVSLAQPSR